MPYNAIYLWNVVAILIHVSITFYYHDRRWTSSNDQLTSGSTCLLDVQ